MPGFLAISRDQIEFEYFLPSSWKEQNHDATDGGDLTIDRQTDRQIREGIKSIA